MKAIYQILIIGLFLFSLTSCKKENVDLTLQRAMEYFLSIEEYEQCAKVRDIQKLL